MHDRTLTNNQKNFGLYYLVAGLLLFWFCWFALATLTNIFDLLHTYGFINSTWRFRSSNFTLLYAVISIYQFSQISALFLFCANLLIQTSSAVLFLFATVAWLTKSKNLWVLINLAFMLTIGLWASFVVMEEFFISYPLEATHIRLIIFELVSLIAIHSIANQRLLLASAPSQPLSKF